MNHQPTNRLFTEGRIKNEHDTFWKQHQEAFFELIQKEKIGTPQPSNQRQFVREATEATLKEKDSRRSDLEESGQGSLTSSIYLQPQMREIDRHDQSTSPKQKTFIQESAVTPEQSLISSPSILHSQIQKEVEQQKDFSPPIQASHKHEEQEQQQEVQEVEGCSFYTIHDPSSSSLRNGSSNQPANECHSSTVKQESIPNQLSIIINQQQAQNRQDQPITVKENEVCQPVCEKEGERGWLECEERETGQNEDILLMKNTENKNESKQDGGSEVHVLESKQDQFINQINNVTQEKSKQNNEQKESQSEIIVIQSSTQLIKNDEGQENSSNNNEIRIDQEKGHLDDQIFEPKDDKIVCELQKACNKTIDQIIAQNQAQIDQIVDNFKEYIQSATQNCLQCSSIRRQNLILRQKLQEQTQQSDIMTEKSQQTIVLLRKEREQNNRLIFELKATLQSLKEELANAKETVTVQTNITRTTSTKNIQTFNQSDQDEAHKPISANQITLGDNKQIDKDIDYESEKNSSDQEDQEEPPSEESEESSNIQIEEDPSLLNTDLPHQKEEIQQDK